MNDRYIIFFSGSDDAGYIQGEANTILRSGVFNFEDDQREATRFTESEARQVVRKLGGGRMTKVSNSTSNPVVQNALAAKNAKFNVGDTVMVPEVYGNYKKLTISSVSSGGTLYRLAWPTGADAGLFAAGLIVKA